jgi:hypothetical protein
VIGRRVLPVVLSAAVAVQWPWAALAQDGAGAAVRPALEWVSVRDVGRTVRVELGFPRWFFPRYTLVRTDDGLRVELRFEGVAVSEGARREISVNRGDLARVLVWEEGQDRPVAVVSFQLSSRSEVSVSRADLPNVIVVSVGAMLPPETRGPPQGPVTISARDTAVADLVAMVAKACGFQVVVVGDLGGKLSVSVTGLSCEGAMEVLRLAAGISWRRVGDVLIVGQQGRVKEDSYPETYRLRHARPDEVAKELSGMVKDVAVSALERDSAVVVVATADKHEEVRRALAILDVAGVQVSIETAVVDISMTRLRELGLSWGIGGPSQGGGQGGIQITVGEAVIVARLSALVSQGQARVIASPRVTTRSGEKASVSLGEDVPIPQRDSNGNITYSFRRVGVGLDITPRVAGDGMVTVDLGLRVEQVLEFLSTPSGPVPRIGAREVKSSVRVRDGDVLVVGGLITRQERESTVKVPLLGDIPVIGSLFRLTTRSESESEVIFLIRPRVVGRPQG